MCGPGNSVGIATDYGLVGPGSNPGGDEIFLPPFQTSCKESTGFFSGGKVRQGRAADHSLLLEPRSWKSRAIPLPTLWATPSL